MMQTLIIDVDGVLADTLKPTLEEINRRYNVDIGPDDIQQWDQVIGPVDIASEMEKYLRRSAFVYGIPKVRGALPAMRKLNALGYHLVVATNREPETNDDTIAWLNDHKFPYHQYVNTRMIGKAALAGDALVDDYHVNIVDFAKTGRPAILLLRPWNETVKLPNDLLIRRAYGWGEILAHIELLRNGGAR